MGEGGGGIGGIFSPGIGIVKSWQGILELSLRVVIIVLSLLMIASGASAQTATAGLPPDVLQIQPLTASAGGWLMFVGFLIVIYQIVFIVQRFLNITIINENITIVIIIDVAVSFGVAFAIFCGAVALASYIPQWEGLIPGNESSFFLGVINRVITASGAATAFAFFTIFALIGHGVFMLVGGLIIKWSPTRGKYEVSGGGSSGAV